MARRSNKLERINLDELFDSPANRGMLSFLERPPQEALDRLREKQKVDAADASRLEIVSRPGGNLPIGERPFTSGLLEQFSNASALSVVSIGDAPGDLPRGDLHTGSEAEIKSPIFEKDFETSVASNGADEISINESPIGKLPIRNVPIGDLPIAPGYNSTIGVDGNVVAEKDSKPPVLKDRLLRELLGKARETDNPSDRLLLGHPGVTYPLGDSSQIRISVAKHPTQVPDQSDTLRGDLIGRRQKIRRVYDVQGGHSSGEQLLYQALWNAAEQETPESKLIVIGYGGMSNLCHLDRKNCKKNIAGLIEKLSLEIVGSYQSTRSEGYTYRIWSYREIKRQREAKGMIWVIRTSGVRFVDPNSTNSPPTGESPIGKLPIGPLQLEPSNSPLGALGEVPRARQGESPSPPRGDSPTHIERQKTKKKNSSPPALADKLQSLIPGIDQGAVDRIWRESREVVPDASVEEVLVFLEERARIIYRNRRLDNPTGLLLSSIKDWFTERRVLGRRGQIAEDAAEEARIMAEIERNLREGGLDS